MSGQRGAILMEHLVAVAILGLVVVAVFNLLAVGSLAAMLADRQSRGTDLAQRLLEEVKAAGYETALSRPRQPVDPIRHPRYEWQLDVTEREPKLKEIAATVYWTVQRGERSVSFVTYLRGQ